MGWHPPIKVQLPRARRASGRRLDVSFWMFGALELPCEREIRPGRETGASRASRKGASGASLTHVPLLVCESGSRRRAAWRWFAFAASSMREDDVADFTRCSVSAAARSTAGAWGVTSFTNAFTAFKAVVDSTMNQTPAVAAACWGRCLLARRSLSVEAATMRASTKLSPAATFTVTSVARPPGSIGVLPRSARDVFRSLRWGLLGRIRRVFDE